MRKQQSHYALYFFAQIQINKRSNIVLCRTIYDVCVNVRRSLVVYYADFL